MKLVLNETFSFLEKVPQKQVLSRTSADNVFATLISKSVGR